MKKIAQWPRSPWFYWTSSLVLFVGFLCAEAIGSPYAQASPPGNWGKFVNKAFDRTNDLLTLSIVSLFAGFGLASLSKVFDESWIPQINERWLPALKDSIETGLREIGTIISKSVDDGKAGIILRTIRDNQLKEDEHNDITLSCLKNLFGDHAKIDDPYSDFLIKEFLYKNRDDGGFVRQTLISTVNIARPDQTHPLYGMDIFLKKERQTFALRNPRGATNYPVSFSSTWRIDKDKLELLIDKKLIEFEYKIGNIHIVDLKLLLLKNRDTILNEGSFDDTDGLRLEHNSGWFRITYRKEIPITGKEVFVSYYTTETLEGDDRVFVSGVMDPTYNFNCRLTLGGGLEGWKVQAPLIGPALYNRSARDSVIVDPAGGGASYVDVTVTRWVLPGIVLALEWTP